MRFLSVRFALTLVLLGMLCSIPGRAESPVSAPDERKVRSVIQAQLKAFASDNAAQAFALATPALQVQFGTPAAFMAMVRSAYPVVYAPAGVAFLKPEQQDGAVIQRVHMNDRDNKAWLAVYSLERQKDGNWRISGCAVTESRGRFI